MLRYTSTTFAELVNLIWYLSIETPLRQFVFFSSAIASPLPPTLLWIAYLTSLLNMFWAIQQALFFLPILRKFAKLKKTNQTKKQQRKTKNKTKNPQRDKVCWLTAFTFTEVEFFSYNMKTLQIIDKFCLNLQADLLNMAYIIMQVIRNERHFIVFPYSITMI